MYGRNEYMAIASKIPTRPVRSEDQKPLWWCDKAERSLKRKHCSWHRYCKGGRTAKLFKEYSKRRRNATKTLREVKFQYERNLSRRIKTNQKSFYRYVNSKKKSRLPVLSLKVAGRTTSNELSICNEFGEVFSAVFTEEEDLEAIYPNDFFQSLKERTGEDFDNIEIEEEDVLKLLLHINPNKSVGPAGIHP